MGPNNDKKSHVSGKETPELKRVFRRMNSMVGPLEREKSVEKLRGVPVLSADVSFRRGRDIENRNLSVKKKIDAYERLNEGQRSIKKNRKSNQPNPKECSKRGKTVEKGGIKGGTFKTPIKRRPKLKPQKFNLKHFWGQKGERDGELSGSD